jgi:hypothetical protein
MIVHVPTYSHRAWRKKVALQEPLYLLLILSQLRSNPPMTRGLPGMSGQGEEQLFKGNPLPDACPPADAVAPGDGLFLRLVPTDKPTPNDFLSCFLENKTPPRRYDACVWRACSFFSEQTPKEKLTDIASYKNHRDKKFIAFVRISNDSGVVKVAEDGHHISFWMYEPFAPETKIEKIEPL